LEQSEENFLTVEEMVRKMEVTILNSEFWSGSGERKETTQSALHETRLALKKTESENDRLKSRISLMQKKVECLISENQELSAINARNETHFRHKLEQSELLIESLRKSIEELTSGRN
jgi:predicted RNase H-like nuclease (RuvC/YqgF family)